MLIIRAYMRLPMAAFSSLSGFTRNTAPMTLPKRLTTGSPIKTPAWFFVLGEYTLSPFSTFCRRPDIASLLTVLSSLAGYANRSPHASYAYIEASHTLKPRPMERS